MASLIQFLAVFGGLYILLKVAQLIYSTYTSSLRNLQAPKRDSFLLGTLPTVFKEDKGELHRLWESKFGKTFRFDAPLGDAMLWTSDHKAIGHILKDDQVYQKAESMRFSLSRILGSGILVQEDEKHKIQRRIMNPAFGPTQIRELTSVFFEKAIKLKDIWSTQVDKETGIGQVDALTWLSKATLDVIGEAGFHYDFGALDGKKNELNDAYSQIFQEEDQRNPFFFFFRILQESIPFLRVVPELELSLRQANQTARRIAERLLYESKTSLSSTGEKEHWNARDLLSLLVRSNMGTEAHQSRMSDEDVMSQVSTFLVAGHETSSTSTTFTLLALTENPDVQTKLREELLAVPTDTPTMEELNALPYLDIVIRETLRYYSPVPSTARTAMEDDIIPFATPYLDKYGVAHDQMRIKKGTHFFIAITAINRDSSLWGADAEEFNPERWNRDNLPEAVSAVPGLYSNMLTFGGGPHSCIGWRFALIEMKALLFTLIRAFEFQLAIPREDLLIKRVPLVQRPVARGKGNQLPVVIKRVSA